MPVIESARATHTTLETASVPRAMRFYRDVLGLRTHRSGERSGHLVDTRGMYAAYTELRDSLVPAGPISYVTLECRDLSQSLRFYRDFLGIDVEQAAPRFFLTRGNGGLN